MLKRNKYTKENCATSWFYLQDLTICSGIQRIHFHTINHKRIRGFQSTGPLVGAFKLNFCSILKEVLRWIIVPNPWLDKMTRLLSLIHKM